MTHFRTNLDCCQPFMWHLNDKTDAKYTEPLVGDLVEVYSDTRTKVELEVVRRTWKGKDLTIELHMPPCWRGRSIQEFEDWVLKRCE